MPQAFKIIFFLSALVMILAHDSTPAQAQVQDSWEKRFQEMDQNRDGKVSLAEYLAFFKEGSPMRRQNIEYEFRKYDRNGDGFITREEHFTPVTLEDQFRALDTNRDGRVSRDEFLDADIIFQALDRNHQGFITLEEYLYRYGTRTARR
ncbi:MAG: EF-hand domain-containing protein [Desulfobaccales bacterium]